ncbi:cbb3-type cytochrome oxidase assembly protein CcoS [Bordetella petrii]
MTILYLLLPLSLLFVLVIGLALGWAVFNGQFDEPDDAAASILSDRDA